MVEFGYVNAQTLQPNQAAILQNIRPCNRRPQRVIHDDMTPNVVLRGIVANPCINGSAQYSVRFSGNIAVATGGTPGEISIALSVDGYVHPLTISMATPAAVGDYWNVRGESVIDVPAGCCKTVTVVNSSADTAVTVQNLDVDVDRVA